MAFFGRVLSPANPKEWKHADRFSRLSSRATGSVVPMACGSWSNCRSGVMGNRGETHKFGGSNPNLTYPNRSNTSVMPRVSSFECCTAALEMGTHVGLTWVMFDHAPTPTPSIFNQTVCSQGCSFTAAMQKQSTVSTLLVCMFVFERVFQ